MSRLAAASVRGRRKFLLLAVLLGASALFYVAQRVEAAPYTNPFWANASPSQESAICDVDERSMSAEGVDLRTGELFWSHFLFRTPGVLEDHVFSFTWRSMINGSSQLGNGIVPNWETTANYVLLLPGTPNAANGHAVDIRRGSGRIDRFVWNGGAYAAPADVFDALTTNAGNYVLADKWGNVENFNANGTLATSVDRNGNTTTWTHTGYQLTGITDTRGKTYTVNHNGNGYISSMVDFAGRTWTFGYDGNDNLTTITTPTTPDQTGGITTTLGYDAQSRLMSVTDGRGNAVWAFAYVGATGQISTVTIDSDTVSHSYAAGITTRTDRNGNVHRTYFTGNQVTKTDMLVASVAKYVTQHRYTGVFPANTVFPRGNRVDQTFDAAGNRTAQRQRTTDTATNDVSDLYQQWGYSVGNFLTSYSDPEGNAWSLTRDGAGNLTGITMPAVTLPTAQTASRSFTVNAKGQRLTATDEESRLVRFNYGASGNSKDLLVKIEVDPNGLDLETSFTHDGAGNIATATDPRGSVWTTTWDNLRRWTQQQAPTGYAFLKKANYDGNDNQTKLEIENLDKDGSQVTANPWWTTTRTFTKTDDLLTLVEEIDASTTRSTTLEYDKNDNRIRVTKPEGNKERWDFDERDLVVKHVLGEGDALESSTQYTYDLNGNLLTATDGRGKVTTIALDLFDRRTRLTNPLGHFAEWTLDKNGNTTRIERKNSAGAVLQRESYSIDERNRRYKVSTLFKDPSATYADAVTTTQYDKTGLAVTVTDARSNDASFTYDQARRRSDVEDAAGNRVERDFDANGNMIGWRIKEKDGAATITHDFEGVYDVLNRLTKRAEIDRTDSANRLDTQYGYDSRNNLVWMVNAENNPTRYTFDGLSRMTKRERALTTGATIEDFTKSQDTIWAFDKNSRMTSFKDDGPNETTWNFDALDRTTRQTFPDTKTVLFEHDPAHNVTKTTDPSGNVTNDTFDDLNRNTSRVIALATGFVGTTSETRAYDELDRMVTNEDNDYKLQYEYAVIGLRSYVAKETQSYVSGYTLSKTVTKTYDAVGNRITEAYPSGSNLSLTNTYDAINQLTAIGDGTNTLASFNRIGWRPKTTTFQSGATATTSYTGFRNEVASVHHQTNTPATILRLDYGYNKVHDRTYERFGAAGSPGDAYLYDKLRRLTNAYLGSTVPTAPAANPYVKKLDYNYDDDGNRTSVVTKLWGLAPTSSAYTTNNLNQYTVVAGTSRTHDNNGNLTNDGTSKYVYNYKNLIVEARLASTNALYVSYKYDAEGRRVEKSVVAGKFERYIRSRGREEEGSSRLRNNPGLGARYDMSQVVATFDSNGAWKQNFVWGERIDQIAVLEQADVLDYDGDANTAEITRSYYHLNALGSVMEITDANQAKVVSYRYTPYGQMTITRGGAVQTADPLGQYWGYTARFSDEETGLWYYRARYYDGATGRMLQRDSAGPLANPRPPELDGRIKWRVQRVPFCAVLHYEYLEKRYRDVGLGYKVTNIKKGRLVLAEKPGPVGNWDYKWGHVFSVTYDVYRIWEVETWRIKGSILVCPPLILPLTRSEAYVSTSAEYEKLGSKTVDVLAKMYINPEVWNTRPMKISDQIASLDEATDKTINQQLNTRWMDNSKLFDPDYPSKLKDLNDDGSTKVRGAPLGA